MEVLVSSQQTLEHSRDVTQIEQVVDLGGRGEELAHDGLVHLDCGLCHDISDRLHFFLKVLQEDAWVKVVFCVFNHSYQGMALAPIQ